MNIAFEISPLITASGNFGDKSGVYRYTYGLILAISRLLKKKHPEEKIILFSFNNDLFKLPLNPDIFRLRHEPNIVLLDNLPKLRKIKLEDVEFLQIPPVKATARLLNKVLPLKSLYDHYTNRTHLEKYLAFLSRVLKKNHVKIIFHSQTGFTYLKGFKNITTIYDLTPIFMEEFHRPETNYLYKKKVQFTKNCCQGVIAISRSTKKDLIRYSAAFKNKKIMIGYPGIDPIFQADSSHLNNNIDALRLITRHYNCRIKKQNYLLYYGTFEPRKNLLYLVQAFSDLQNHGEIPSAFKLVLIGGAGWGNVKTMICQYIINENFPSREEKKIIVADYLNDKYLLSLIKNAYAVIYPSLYEGFGLPVLESMAVGTPVLCSANSSLPEVGGQAVLYFNPNNFFDMQEKIKKLINNPQLALELSQRGQLQSQKFSWAKTGQKVYQFIQKL